MLYASIAFLQDNDASPLIDDLYAAHLGLGYIGLEAISR